MKRSSTVKTHRAYKVELVLNNKQTSVLNNHAGAARWAYNWGLATWIRLYEERKSIVAGTSEKVGSVTSAIDLHKRLVQLKKIPIEDGGVPWLYDVSKCAPHEALRDLQRAYENTFARLAQGKKGGFPRFKSKHKSRKSFRLGGCFTVEPKRIRLPNIGWVKLAEVGYIPEDANIKSVTVSEKAGRWFVSVLTEVEQTEMAPNTDGPVLGIDLGINALATLSDGTVYENPRPLKKVLGAIKKLSKRMSRQQRGSNRRRKTKDRLAKVHARATNIRGDGIHKMTTEIVRTKRPSVIVLENLNVRGMMKNHKLAGSVADASFGEIRRQFQYKSVLSGVGLVLADRYYPSSKRCSGCGFVKGVMGLGERVFTCGSCGFTANRDYNASLNLRDYPSLITASSAGCARGGDVRPSNRKVMRQTSLKREVNGKSADLPHLA